MMLRRLPPEAPLSIGEVVRRTGKAASTIRYYEDIGLIAPPERVSGRRRYESAVVRDLAIVDTAQRAGLSLDEIRLLLEASPHDSRSTERLRAVAERKLPELTAAIARAQVVLGWLKDAAHCRCPTLDDCPSSTSRRDYRSRLPVGNGPSSSRLRTASRPDPATCGG